MTMARLDDPPPHMGEFTGGGTPQFAEPRFPANCISPFLPTERESP